MVKGGKTGRSHVTPVQTAKIYNLLSEFIHNVNPDTGMCEYKNNLDDQKIAGMVGTGVAASAVSRIRMEGFGKISASPGHGRGSMMQKQMDDLKAEMAELTEKHNKLIETLSLNQVAKVRHLAIAKVA